MHLSRNNKDNLAESSFNINTILERNVQNMNSNKYIFIRHKSPVRTRLNSTPRRSLSLSRLGKKGQHMLTRKWLYYNKAGGRAVTEGNGSQFRGSTGL